MNDVLEHWTYRWSKLCVVDGRWHVHIPTLGVTTVTIRRWRWWRPDDLVRYVLHRYWARRFW